MTAAAARYSNPPSSEPNRRPRRRRPTHAQPGARSSPLSRFTIAAGLRNTIAATWAADTFGPLTAAWLPSSAGMTPELRLAYLVELADGYLKQVSAGRWGVRLDAPQRPSVMILDGAGEPGLLSCHFRGRNLYAGGSCFGLASEATPTRLIEHFSFRLAAHFGA